MSCRRLSWSIALGLLLAACGPTFERGADDASIDRDALSVGLDASDLSRAADEWYAGFVKSPRMVALPADRRTLAVLSVSNETSQYIAPQLAALVDALQSRIVNDGTFRLVSRDQLATNAVLAERMNSASDFVDPGTSIELGREFGVHHVVTGRVGDNVERISGRKRVQYFLTLKVTSVETSELMYQQQVQITKQVRG